MKHGLIFSWAENAEGRMVHVDDVPRGKECGCVCPCCHEKLLARHGEVKGHGFAHHSESRGANLKICYEVTMYKLAEQIIQTEKRIHTSPYHGIFKETDICFKEVKIDSQYERDDKQPDVIATTEDGKQYLIEFVFEHKVQHKKAIDYKSLTCLEVDLSNQSLETLESFLLSSSDNRNWLNNEVYFSQIEATYRESGKIVRVVCEEECKQCRLKNDCCAVKEKDLYSPLIVKNSGKEYCLCKTELYERRLQELESRIKEEELFRQERFQREQEQKQLQEKRHENREKEESEDLDYLLEYLATKCVPQRNATRNEDIAPNLRSCFICEKNLSWKNRDGWANCGPFETYGLPERINPNRAVKCPWFEKKK